MSLSVTKNLPLLPEELTTEWIESALSVRYPEVKLLDSEVCNVVAGTASKIKVSLKYDNGNPYRLPETMYIKGGFHGAEQLELAGAGYHQEVGFYQNFEKQLDGLEIPTSYFSGASEANGQAIVFLEDLTQRNATFGNATEPMSVDLMAKTMEWCARLHASFWNRPPANADIPWPGVVGSLIDVMLAEDYWGAMTSRPLAQALPDVARDPKVVRRALLNMWETFNSQSKTFIHGDAHLGNMYFVDNAPGFLDWQSPMLGPWSDDVTYALIGGLTVADRRANERQLLKHYLDALKGFGVEAVPSFDEAWLAYRQQVMHGYMWVCTPPSMQPDDIVGANVERFSAALEDLETLNSLGV